MGRANDETSFRLKNFASGTRMRGARSSLTSSSGSSVAFMVMAGVKVLWSWSLSVSVEGEREG